MGLPLPSEDDGNTDGIASHDERWECPRCSAAAPAPMQVNRQTMTLVVHVREYMNESIEKTVLLSSKCVITIILINVLIQFFCLGLVVRCLCPSRYNDLEAFVLVLNLVR